MLGGVMPTSIPVDHWGIQDGYHDATGQWRPVSPETRTALREAMAWAGTAAAGDERDSPAEPHSVVVALAGEPAPLPPGYELTLEDGTVLGDLGALPSDTPIGYHRLHPAAGGAAIHLLVAPARCYRPDDLRIWGWAAQLYALRSAQSWGIGDLGDLGRLARWSAAELGAGAILVNPLGATLPLPTQQPSPYFASSRCYRNPLYLRIEDVPGAAEARLDLASLAAAGAALNRGLRIDRDAVFRVKMDALRRLWARFGQDPRFEAYCREQGELLRRFSAFNALAERHGSGWSLWPEEHRHPDGPDVQRFVADHVREVRFHQWLQWLLDEQMAAASRGLRVFQDLPVGFDLGGADAWMWQDLLAPEVTIGAPPDPFNAAGQDWGLPPFVPHRLRAAGYEPLAQSLRAVLRHAGGVRIDHVMGLWRLFWIPRGRDADEGAYVRYRADEMLAVVAIESQRARAIIVGEDLGTVEDGVREEMTARHILSCCLLWFDMRHPSQYPAGALTSVTTHDLPTIAGLWTGADLDEQRRLGLAVSEEDMRQVRERVAERACIPEGAAPDEVVERTYVLLGEAPSAIVMATLEDALAVSERPNIPGTTTERANWAIALPGGLEAVERAALPRRIAAALARGAAPAPPRPAR
jgi:4-alpha-glucanotransferase